MYINTETLEYPVSENEIRSRNPNTSFSLPFVAPQPYVWVFPTPTAYDPVLQRCQETSPELTTLGHWEQRWTYTDIPVEEQATIAEATRISRVPYSVSPRQIRQGLTSVGLRVSVEAAIAAADQDTKDWYEFAAVFERNHPMVTTLATALNVTERQLDDLWTLAGTL